MFKYRWGYDDRYRKKKYFIYQHVAFSDTCCHSLEHFPAPCWWTMEPQGLVIAPLFISEHYRFCRHERAMLTQHCQLLLFFVQHHFVLLLPLYCCAALSQGYHSHHWSSSNVRTSSDVQTRSSSNSHRSSFDLNLNRYSCDLDPNLFHY